MSARETDINDFILVKGNPLSKVGVFPYSGRQIDDPSLDPDKIYQVLRPADELSKEETLSSFRLLPLIDEHPSQVLGSKDKGRVAAEQHGVHGTTTENIYFEDGYLKGDLKIFSDSYLGSDKKELSIGYRCKFIVEPGTFEGVKYDAVQREIFGNHVALVKEGRAGPDVAVLDEYTFTFDTMELNMQEPMAGSVANTVENTAENIAEKVELTLEGLNAKIETLVAAVAKLAAAEMQEEKVEEEVEEEIEEVLEDDMENTMDEDEDDKKKKEEKKTVGDSAMRRKTVTKSQTIRQLISEVSQRDKLAEQVSRLTGTFDHSDMTTQDVVKYGLKEFRLSAPKGQERAVLSGYLAGRKLNNQKVTMDAAKPIGNQLKTYIDGGK